MIVVFTGRYNTAGPRSYDRAELCRMAHNVNIQVVNTVSRSVDTLVASRTNTVKARRSRDLGIPVITYEAFLDIVRERARRLLDSRNGRGRIGPLPDRDGGRMGMPRMRVSATQEELKQGIVHVEAIPNNPPRQVAIGAPNIRRLDLGDH